MQYQAETRKRLGDLRTALNTHVRMTQHAMPPVLRESQLYKKISYEVEITLRALERGMDGEGNQFERTGN